MNNMNVIEEKFTRCPQCRSFSVRVSTEYTRMEKIKANFLPVSVFKCDNCAYRFVTYGTLSAKLKRLVVVIPIGLVVAVVALFFLLPKTNHHQTVVPPKTNHPQTTTHHNTIQTVPDKKLVKEQTPIVPAEKVPEQKIPVDNPVATDIILGTSDRFGSNWTPVATGVRITRLSNGPLKTAGILVGDILTEVAGEKIGTGDTLLKMRGEIFSGRREEALIKVIRNKQTLFFRLLKIKKDKTVTTNKETTPPVKVTPQVQPPAQDSVKPLGQSQVIKIISGSIIKIRSSAPDSEDRMNRWRFFKTTVSVRRTEAQRVFVAGDAAGIKKWGVDDQLIIKGQSYQGLTNTFSTAGVMMPDDVKCAPLDITNLVPVGQQVRLNVELLDHGKLWGNSDIYIVVKNAQ